MVCVGIYAVLVQNIAVGDDITVAIWECMGYTVLLCYTLFKTGSLAKACLGHIKGDINWGRRSGPEGPDKNQEQDAVRPDEAAACVFRIGGACGSAAFLFEQGQHGYDLGGAVHDLCHAPVLPICSL